MNILTCSPKALILILILWRTHTYTHVCDSITHTITYMDAPFDENVISRRSAFNPRAPLAASTVPELVFIQAKLSEFLDDDDDDDDGYTCGGNF